MGKKTLSLLLSVLMLALALTGCGETPVLSSEAEENSASEILEETSSSSQESTNSSSEQIIFRGIGVDKIDGWKCTSEEYAIQNSPNRDMTVSFITSNLIFNETPQETFNNNVESEERYSGNQVKTCSEKVEPFTSKDGIECFAGHIVTYYPDFGTYKCRQIVIVPSLELEVTFIGETENSNYDELLTIITNLSKTITFNNDTESSSSSKTDDFEATPEQDERVTETVNGDMTFDIEKDWTQSDSSVPIYQLVKNSIPIAVGLNGVSPLSKGTPQEVFDEFVKFYETDANPNYKTVDYSKSVSEFTAKDGTQCYYGTIFGKYINTPYLCDVVIVPSKNRLISFMGQSSTDSNEDLLLAELKLLRESLTFLNGSEDKITGGTFILDDGSEMALNDDLTFKYYRSQDDHSTDYYEGTYEVYRGEKAFDKLSSMDEYGLTREELDEMYDNHKSAYIFTPEDAPPFAEGTAYNICLDDFYAVVLHREKIVREDGTREIGNDNVYFGYWLEEGGFAYLTNADQINSSKWIPKN